MERIPVDRPGSGSGMSQLAWLRKVNHQDDAKVEVLDLYLRDLRKHDLLTREDERVLGAALHEGREAEAQLASVPRLNSAKKRELNQKIALGKEAERIFIVANLRLVVSIAKRYQRHTTLPLVDLIQEGNIGLINAVKRFDHRKGFKFSTYATWWVRQAVRRGVSSLGSPVRLSGPAEELLRAARKVSDRLERSLGRPATLAEIADVLGVDVRRVADVMLHPSVFVPFDEPVGLSGLTVAEVIPGDEAEPDVLVQQASDVVAVRALLEETLTSRQRMVLEYRWGLNDGSGEVRTQRVTGVVFGVSKERIRQIEREAFRRLRDSMGGQSEAV